MKESKMKQLFKLIGDHFLGYGVATEAIDKWNNDTEFQSKLVEIISDSFKTRTKKVDPENKKPKNSFLEYCADHRQKVKDSLVDQSAAAISRKLGEDWKMASEDVKKPYIDLAKSKLDEYNAKKELIPSLKAENKPSDMPVKNLNIWQIFCRINKDKVTTTPKQPELIRIWNELKISNDDKDIETYKELEREAAKEKEIYKQALASYKENTGWKPITKPKKYKDKDAPPRAKSVYDIYRDNQLPGLKALHGKDAMAQMRANWNIFKTQEGILQEEYKRLAKEDKDRYTNEMKIHVQTHLDKEQTEIEADAKIDVDAKEKIDVEAKEKIDAQTSNKGKRTKAHVEEAKAKEKIDADAKEKIDVEEKEKIDSEAKEKIDAQTSNKSKRTKAHVEVEAKAKEKINAQTSNKGKRAKAHAAVEKAKEAAVAAAKAFEDAER